MKTLLDRFLAYLCAGIGLGGGTWLVAVDAPPPAAVTVVVVGLVLALWRLGRAYRAPTAAPPKGMDAVSVRITPRVSLVAMDSVALIASALTVFFAVDGFGPRLAGVGPLLTDPLAADVIALLYLPAAFVLAAFVTTTGEQSLSLGPKGLFLGSPFGARSALWADVVSIGWRDQYVVVSRVGVPMPRKLRTNLDIHTKQGARLTVFEPATAAGRRSLLDGMMTFAPRPLTKDLQGDGSN